MKRFWLGISLLILCLGAYVPASLAQNAADPRMVLREKSFDFKEVNEGKVLEHAFKVFNEGPGPLQIIKVRPD